MFNVVSAPCAGGWSLALRGRVTDWANGADERTVSPTQQPRSGRCNARCGKIASWIRQLHGGASSYLRITKHE